MISSKAFAAKFAPITVAVACLTFCAARLEAVIVGTGDGTGNNTAPTDDPGWANVGIGFYSLVYIGNGWMLEAYHCHALAIQNGSGDFATINGQSYGGIAGSGIRLTDPTTQKDADLYMFRINGNPNLNSLGISQTAPSAGSTVRAVGSGLDRVTGATATLWDASWNVLPPGSPNPAHSGFYYATPNTSTKRWGDNLIAGTPVTINAGYGDTNAVYTYFDKNGIANEFQAATGDSGGGLFYKNGGYWQLTGILDAISPFQIPTGNAAVFGDATFAVDLSYYRSQIVSAVQVFQISGPVLANPSAAMGTTANWQSVQLIGNGGFGASTGSWSLPVDTNGYTFTLDTGSFSSSFQSAAVISGNGGLTKNGTGTLTVFSANTFTGATNVAAGTLVLRNASALQNSTLNYTTGTVTFNAGIGAFTLGGLSGSKALTLTDSTNTAISLSVGNNNQTTVFSGAIDGGGSLTKIGLGTLTLTGTTTFTGNTTVLGGTLSLSTLQTPGKTVSVLGASSLLTATSITANTLRIDSTGAASSFASMPLSAAIVPEPTTLALLILGLLGLGVVAFRKRTDGPI